jgi:formate-dependent nitrite reductase membrane component NrfD
MKKYYLKFCNFVCKFSTNTHILIAVLAIGISAYSGLLIAMKYPLLGILIGVMGYVYALGTSLIRNKYGIKE